MDDKEQPTIVLPQFKITGTAINTPPKTETDEEETE